MYEKLSANYYGCFVGPRRLFLVAGGGGGGDQRLHAMVDGGGSSFILGTAW